MSKISRTMMACAAALCAFSVTNANATIYTYTLSGGTGLAFINSGKAPNQATFAGTLVVDTRRGTGTFTGGGVDASFTGDFSRFVGGARPTAMFDINISSSSSITYANKTYRVINAHQPMLDFETTAVNLWAVWAVSGCPSCAQLGDTVVNISGYSVSDEDTPVPEPGVVGLVGLGAAALWLRRRKLAAPALQFA